MSAAMAIANPSVVRARLRDEADRILLERTRIAVWLVIAALPLYAVVDWYIRRSALGVLQLFKLILMTIGVLVLLIIRRPRHRRRAREIGLVLLASVCFISAASGNLTNDYTGTAFLSGMTTLFTGALAPWGAATQLLAVGLVAVATLWNVHYVSGGFGVLFGTSSIVIAITWATSVYLAHLLEQSRIAFAQQQFAREQAQQALHDEAQIAAALARVGQELIASVGAPALLERLCQLTAEALGCDCSWTVLRKPDSALYVVSGHYGFPPDQSESVQHLAIPGATVADFLAQLEREELVQFVGHGTPDTPLARLHEQYGLTSRVYVALRRGGEIVGFQGAAYRGGTTAFTGQQQRLLHGIAHLASLALETARLVDELAQASHFKSDFVANMSHELRTPLNVIIGYHDLLLDGAFGALPAEQHDIVQRADKSARELLELINATLDLSRFEAGELTLERRDVRIADLFADLARDIDVLTEKPALTVSWHVAPDLPLVRTDSVKMRMVLKNLVRNAIKFTQRGTVDVTAQQRDGGIEFCVRDTGIGIARDEQARIFEPFYQARATATERASGAGLGLYIVRRLLQMLGGTIAVESEPGHGSTFRVWLPLTP